MGHINRRETERMEVKLRCHLTSSLTWPRPVTGETENISRTGILLNCQTPAEARSFAAGDLVTVEIELPANHGFGQKCIHCQGTVVRVDEKGTRTAVALRVNYMQFREYIRGFSALRSTTPVAPQWMT